MQPRQSNFLNRVEIKIMKTLSLIPTKSNLPLAIILGALLFTPASEYASFGRDIKNLIFRHPLECSAHLSRPEAGPFVKKCVEFCMALRESADGLQDLQSRDPMHPYAKEERELRRMEIPSDKHSS